MEQNDNPACDPRKTFFVFGSGGRSEIWFCLLIYPHLLVFIPFSNVTGTTDQKTIKFPNPFNPLTHPRKLFTALVHAQWQNCGGTH